VEAIILFHSQIADDSYLNKLFFIGLFLISLTVFLATPSFAKDYSFSWSANSSQVDGYKLYYKKGGSAGPPFDGYDAIEGESPIIINDLTSITVSGLEDNTTYHFALTAYDGLDESDFTDTITVFPGDDQQDYDGLDESDFTDTITVFPGDDQQERVAKVLTIINTYLLLESE